MRRSLSALILLSMVIAGCGGSPLSHTAGQRHPVAGGTVSTRNIYAADGANMLVDATKDVPYRLYVPNSDETSMMEVDPNTGQIIKTMPVGKNPQHVVPAWDLKTLYVTNDKSNSLTPVDPKTGERAGPDISVDDPYNMYFTPTGSDAIVVAEARQNLDFRDPHTFALRKRVHVDCAGVDHIDFAADNSYLIATCEFSGKLVKVSLPDDNIVGYITLPHGSMPQDIKLDPAGEVFYVADMTAGGLWEVDANTFTNVGFLPTGPEAHGLYPSRDAKHMYVSNRGGMEKDGDKGSVSVIDFATRKVVANWPIPAPSTPDMGGVSADGTMLWLSGRRTSEIYGIDTRTGTVAKRIKVGKGPHGLCVWPQPGKYSLGHTGILR